MNTARQAVLRWATKVFSSKAKAASQGKPFDVKTLDAEQLRQVGGGTGSGSAQLPNGTW